MTWLRYNETIDTFSDPLYQMMEIADTRQGLASSYFRSVLNVKSISGALGRQRYTCILRNTFGSDSEHITLHREGIIVTLMHQNSKYNANEKILFLAVITIESPLETLYGDLLRLVCHTVALPTEYASRVQIEWWGPNGAALNESVTVGVQQSDGSTLSRSLEFAFLRSTMDGVYTCHFHIEHMNETYTETKTYTLEVSGIANETLCCECVCLWCVYREDCYHW